MRINTDRVVSLSAMLVGLGSLFIIVYQTALLREQQQASALPYVMVGILANPDRTYITARNTGVGPALIEDVVVRYHGNAIGRLVSAGEVVLLLGTEGEGAPALPAEFLRLFDLGDAPQSWYDGVEAPKAGPDKAIIEITYRSVYGDRFRAMADTVVPLAL